jgi:hypothetical protein
VRSFGSIKQIGRYGGTVQISGAREHASLTRIGSTLDVDGVYRDPLSS